MTHYDSAVVNTASKARLTVRNTIEWARTAWKELSLNTVKNYWNHAKILPKPVTSGPTDSAIDELKALLVEFSDSSIDVENSLSHVSEQLTEAPQSDDEKETAVYEAREASDEEEADESEPVVLMTLREARALGQAVKIFVQENQGCERMRPYLSAIESLVRQMEAMPVSARTQQLETDMHDCFLPARAVADVSPAAGAQADKSVAFQLCVYPTEYSGLTLFSY